MDNSFKSNVAQVKVAYNIVDYMQQSGITLKQHGMKWKGLCPFHNENTPSFTVDEHYQNYRCFGCGEHGDLISFVTKYEHLEFWEALTKLAEDKGIEIKAEEGEERVDYTSLRSCIKTAANFYYKQFKSLPDTHVAKQEIVKAERNLSLNKMRYGYAPEGRTTLYNVLKKDGFSDETILATGVCSKTKTGKIFDFWQGRLMFFITDISGRPIGFSGRKLYENDTRGKYVNSLQGPLFDKSSALFNIDKAKDNATKEGRIFVTEGQFDVGAFVEASLVNVVASSGTAFTEKQAMICRRLVTENGKIVFAFDGDEAGQKAARHVFENIPIIHTQSYVVSFPDEQDPCDYRAKYGSEKLVKYVEDNTIPLVEFMLNIVKKKYDLDNEIDRSKYVNEASVILKTIKNTSLQEIYIRRVALDSFLSVDAVKNVVKEAIPMKQRSVSIDSDNVEVSDSDNVVHDVQESNIVVELMNNDLMYNCVARMIAIAFQDRRYTKPITKLLPVIPADFHSFVKEMSDIDAPYFIPELFTQSDIAQFIVDSNFFPLIHIMNAHDVKDQFMYLRKYLIDKNKINNADNVHMKISRILDASKNGGADLLEKALERESQELNVKKD